jgi:hypothetical protein
MKKYSLVSAVFSTVLVVLFGYYLFQAAYLDASFVREGYTLKEFIEGNPSLKVFISFCVFGFLISIICSAILYLNYFLAERMNSVIRKIISILAIPCSIFASMGFVYFVIVFAYNIAQIQPVKPITISYELNKDEKLKKNFEEYYNLLKSFADKEKKRRKEPNSLGLDFDELFSEDPEYKKDEWDKILEYSKTERENIINFLSKNTIAYPIDLSFSFDNEGNNYLSPGLMGLFQMEHAWIEKEIKNNPLNKKVILVKYINLWMCVDSLYNAKDGSMGQYLINVGTIRSLTSVISEHGTYFNVGELEPIKNITDRIIKKQDEFQQNMWYIEGKNNEHIGMYKVFQGFFPIYSINETLSLNNQINNRDIEYTNNEGKYDFQYDKNKYKELDILSSEKMPIERILLLKNPSGLPFLKLRVGASRGLSRNCNEKKMVLRALNYLLDNKKSNEPPIDFMSGEKMIYTENNGICEIIGYSKKIEKNTNEESLPEPSYRFKIMK